MNGLDAERIPDPATAGDFLRRFDEAWIFAQEPIHETRTKIWALQDASFRKEAILDVDETIAETTGACTILNSKEINAFALPGGFLFIERGLLEAADDESELPGVMGHELSHVVARHGHKLMTKSTIASVIYQGAEVAAVVLTGGAASVGAYYALQYGF